MEHLTGESLGALLRRVMRLDVSRALNISIQAAEGLGAAHAKGVLHRDLKPDNVFLITKKTERDFVKILDFGLAKLLDADVDPGNTATGHTVGTPYYMAPEQCEGKKDIDARADIYALGVILYHSLSGQLPFDGSIRGNVMLEHLCDPVPSLRQLLPDLPQDVEQVINCALEKDRENRYPSMTAMAHAMRRARQRLDLSVVGREIPTKRPFRGPVSESWDTIPDGLPPVLPETEESLSADDLESLNELTSANPGGNPRK
jgi:serine/threonine-protein kinase